MTSSEIRQIFLDFFHSKQHQLVPSAPMVVKNDPTLMFTNAGMNQFKDIFLGNTPPTYTRIADTQKCLRVSGKHNDLEEVGFDTYHHTMFEMLGNWSFGDYFKKEAIEWAWELLTDVYKIDKEILYVTVFEGDEPDGLACDTDAMAYWKKLVPGERILVGNKKDNFWEMGDTGPCGPCSEIHADIRSPEERKKIPGRNLVNKGHPEVIEIWNLVFIEFNRMADGRLTPLPSRHVDTGMGFERLCRLLQKENSNYNTDVFQPIILQIATLCGIPYGKDEKADVSMRVIADHIRAISFAIADGQVPTNVKAGYVIRRILRRAVRFGYSFLDFREPFLYQLVPVLIKTMGKVFPELHSQKDLIMKVIHNEETLFLHTLVVGLQKFENYLSSHPGEKTVNGQFTFELFDTYGFPVDLTQLMAREKGMEVDMEDFKRRLDEQKARSRKDAEKDSEDWVTLVPAAETEFVGWDTSEQEARITRYRKVKEKGKEYYQLILDSTPFYAESGGQVGDTGKLEYEDDTVNVLDTKKENNLILHITDRLPKYPDQPYNASVDKVARAETMRNHTATHLIHKALREVLGNHVEQKGSLVDPHHLRFDFSHYQKVTEEEMQQVEKKVNEWIRENLPRQERRAIPMEEAKELGAMALFDEKYSEKVRLIQFGHSLELCGGTHVEATGEIGFCKIISEGATAAGIRRIEAVTGTEAERYIDDQIRVIDELKLMLKAPKDLVKSVNTLLEENTALRKQIQEFQKEKAKNLHHELVTKVENTGSFNFLATQVDLDAQGVKDLAFELRNSVENLFLVIGYEKNNKPGLAVMLSDNLVSEKGMDASVIIRELAREIEGGGGGQPFFATAGGKKPGGLQNVFQKARHMAVNK
ncbi:MAG: alanine--tRNA ligase [Bacteroidetes bacterium]|nr:alanine--tRNA ligase [Bacteroidota bacterium]